MKRFWEWVMLPVYVVLVIRQIFRCKRGWHSGTEPNGYCLQCGEKVEIGRMDIPIPEGCLYVWEEQAY